MTYRPLTLRCSYCDGGSMWYTEQDQHEYCPAHLFIAQLKGIAWEAAAQAVRDLVRRELVAGFAQRRAEQQAVRAMDKEEETHG